MGTDILKTLVLTEEECQSTEVVVLRKNVRGEYYHNIIIDNLQPMLQILITGERPLF